MDPKTLINKLAKKEAAFLKERFLAPVVKGGRVCVRLQGVVCCFQLEDKDIEGWGIFQATSFKSAVCLRPARKKEVRHYLKMLPSVTVIIAEPVGLRRRAVVAHPAGSKVKVDGFVWIHLVERAGLFQHIKARFDGFNFWHECRQPDRNPAHADFLRRALEKEVALDHLHRPGLLPREKSLYAALLKQKRSTQEDPERRLIRKALEHGGARLRRFEQKEETCTVTYVVDGMQHRSVIRADDLTVLSAGICLSDQDRKFDLQSLVGVLREGRQSGEIYG